MMKLKHLFENLELAKEAITYYEISNIEILSCFRISSNAIYPFRSDEKVYYLRLAPYEEKLEKNIKGEIEFLNYLIDNKYNAVVPIKNRNDKYYFNFNSKWGGYYVTCFEKVDGKALDDCDLNLDILFKYGKELGNLHNLSTNYTPNAKKWDYEEVILWIKDQLEIYNAPLKMKNEAILVEKALNSIIKTKENYGLIHYDFEPDNVFYDNQKDKISVIDFDDGMYHFYSLDIEQALDCLDDLNEKIKESGKKSFIDGYNSVKSYTKEMEEQRPLMRRFINLFGYTRLTRSTFEKFDNEPDWMKNLRLKLNKVIKQLEDSVK